MDDQTGLKFCEEGIFGSNEDDFIILKSIESLVHQKLVLRISQNMEIRGFLYNNIWKASPFAYHIANDRTWYIFLTLNRINLLSLYV